MVNRMVGMVIDLTRPRMLERMLHASSMSSWNLISEAFGGVGSGQAI